MMFSEVLFRADTKNWVLKNRNNGCLIYVKHILKIQVFFLEYQNRKNVHINVVLFLSISHQVFTEYQEFPGIKKCQMQNEQSSCGNKNSGLDNPYLWQYNQEGNYKLQMKILTKQVWEKYVCKMDKVEQYSGEICRYMERGGIELTLNAV